jgi:hypothetical protein
LKIFFFRVGPIANLTIKKKRSAEETTLFFNS